MAEEEAKIEKDYRQGKERRPAGARITLHTHYSNNY